MDPLTMLLISGIGQAIGLSGSARQNRKMDNYLQGMVGQNKAQYDKEYNTNYLDTDEAKSAIRNMLEQIKEATGDANSSAAITGASAEKQVAQKSEMGKNFNQAVTGLAGRGTMRKEMIKDRYLNRKSQLDQMVLGNMQNKSNNWTQFGQNAAQLGLTGLLSGMGGAGVPQAGTFGLDPSVINQTGTNQLLNIKKNSVLYDPEFFRSLSLK